MTGDALTALSPYIALAAAAVVAMLAIAVRRDHAVTAGMAVAGLVVSAGLIPLASSVGPVGVTELLIVDDYALLYLGLLVAATFFTALLSYGYLQNREGRHEEFYVLLVLGLLGSAVLAASRHFASFFLGLETLSISLYTMIGYLRRSPLAIEAAVKYLILAAASSAVLLFGMALIYAQTGTLQFGPMAEALTAEASLLTSTGLALLIGGVGFKLALVPFHLWTPDVYEGAPAPVAGFIATVSKGGMFALILRYFEILDLRPGEAVFLVFAVIAFASMFAGNLLALLQSNVKRILAYSSIAHFGYLLIAFLAGSPAGATAVTFYLTAYFVTILAAFGVVAVVSTEERDLDAVQDYRGLFWRRPWLGGLFAGALLSLIGMPLTAGFIAKFYVFRAGVEANLWVLAWSLVISTAIGLYYYLRIIVTMFLPEPAAEVSPAASLLPTGRAALAVLGLTLLWLGVYPTPLIEMIESAPPAALGPDATASTEIHADRSPAGSQVAAR